MSLLADTSVLLWAAQGSPRLSEAARALIQAEGEEGRRFSAASIWEVAIKSALGKPDFAVDPRRLRRGLLDNGWRELAVTSEHAAAVFDLPLLHKDPFDRLLLAQARVEGVTLLTSDEVVASYPAPVRRV